MCGGSGALPQEILHALNCVLGAPEAIFHACTQYICTCKLPSSISGFRSKNAMYGALASGLRSVNSIKREAKEQVDFNRKCSETKPLKKLDWNVTDKHILFEQVRHCLGPPLHWGPGANCPCCPPPPPVGSTVTRPLSVNRRET